MACWLRANAAKQQATKNPAKAGFFEGLVARARFELATFGL